jgi:hypothetical protein
MIPISSWFKSLFWASSFPFLKNNDLNIGKCPYTKEMDFCLNQKLANMPFCTLGQVESNNQKPYFILEKLLHEPFFRYFKVNFTLSISFNFS